MEKILSLEEVLGDSKLEMLNDKFDIKTSSVKWIIIVRKNVFMC